VPLCMCMWMGCVQWGGVLAACMHAHTHYHPLVLTTHLPACPRHYALHALQRMAQPQADPATARQNPRPQKPTQVEYPHSTLTYRSLKLIPYARLENKRWADRGWGGAPGSGGQARRCAASCLGSARTHGASPHACTPCAPQTQRVPG